jgi:hypothetical protein
MEWDINPGRTLLGVVAIYFIVFQLLGLTATIFLRYYLGKEAYWKKRRNFVHSRWDDDCGY